MKICAIELFLKITLFVCICFLIVNIFSKFEYFTPILLKKKNVTKNN